MTTEWEKLWAAPCLDFGDYDFCRTPPRVTPAMESGIADHDWTIGERLGSNVTY